MKSRQRKVDPVTGLASTAFNAITYRAFQEKRKVDPDTGEPSSAFNAITYNVFIKRRTVDPETGKPSSASNAISYSVFQSRKTVDPDTGKPSSAPNAIFYSVFKSRKTVDPDTGKPSSASNAISYYAFKAKKKVDPNTGKPSSASNAISYNVFIKGKKVDPNTGEPSTAPNAIFRRDIYNRREKLKDKSIKPEPEDFRIFKQNKLIKQFDRENFKRVANILRGGNNTSDNCAYLVQAFIDYLLTSEMPSHPAPTKSASLEHLTFEYKTGALPVQIKLEAGANPPEKLKTVETVTYSTINRNTIFGAYTPLGERFIERNGTVDLTMPTIYDIDHANQKSVYFSELNTTLQNEAERNGGMSFGMVSLAPCGKYVNQLWHCIVYYATSNKVVYVDCQLEDPVFDNLEEHFDFIARQKTNNAETFGNAVFYISCCPMFLAEIDESTVARKRKRADSDTEGNETKRQRPDMMENIRSTSDSPISVIPSGWIIEAIVNSELYARNPVR